MEPRAYPRMPGIAGRNPGRGGALAEATATLWRHDYRLVQTPYLLQQYQQRLRTQIGLIYQIGKNSLTPAPTPYYVRRILYEPGDAS